LGRASFARLRQGALSIAALVFLALPAFGQAGCAEGRVLVQTGAQTHAFSIELADTDATRAQGLMNRPFLPSAAGMLFAYPAPQRAQFWMANTLIPLDMIFAAPDGTILGVHANAIPHDRTTIDGGAGVQYVLEINGGLAARLGIKAGGALHHPIIAGSDCAPK
jgi:uncharacterized protein